MKKLLTVHAVSSVFLDAVHAFGSKVSGEDDPLFSICHHALSDAPNVLGASPGGQCYGEPPYSFHVYLTELIRNRVLLHSSLF